jgi:hypothetical protein
VCVSAWNDQRPRPQAGLAGGWRVGPKHNGAQECRRVASTGSSTEGHDASPPRGQGQSGRWAGEGAEEGGEERGERREEHLLCPNRATHGRRSD